MLLGAEMRRAMNNTTFLPGNQASRRPAGVNLPEPTPLYGLADFSSSKAIRGGVPFIREKIKKCLIFSILSIIL
jgi:hypothetical protein